MKNEEDDETLNQAVGQGTAKDQAELSLEEQKEYALAPLYVTCQLLS